MPAMVASLESRLSVAGKDKVALEARLAEAAKKEDWAAQAVAVLKAELAQAAGAAPAARLAQREPTSEPREHVELQRSAPLSTAFPASERPAALARRRSFAGGAPDPRTLMEVKPFAARWLAGSLQTKIHKGNTRAFPLFIGLIKLPPGVRHEVHVAFVSVGGSPGRPDGPMLCPPLRLACPKDHPVSWLFSEALRHAQVRKPTLKVGLARCFARASFARARPRSYAHAAGA